MLVFTEVRVDEVGIVARAGEGHDRVPRHGRHAVTRVDRQRADVGRHHQVGTVDRLWIRGLIGKDVEAGASEPAVVERLQ